MQELWQNWTLGEGLLETRWRSIRQSSTSNNSNPQKGKGHKKGKGKGKHVDVVETNQLSETASTAASTVSYPSQTPSTIGELSCTSNVEPWIMGVTINSVSIGKQAGAECLLLDSGAQLHACPITFSGQKIPLLDPGIHTASGARLQHDGVRLVTNKLPEGRTIRVLFFACAVQKTVLSLGCLAQQEYWSDLRADTGTLFFPDKIQTKQPNTRCKICVESRGHDSPRREQSKIDAVVPQLEDSSTRRGYCGWVTEALCRSRASSWEQTPLLEPSTRRWCPTPRRWTCPMLSRQQPNGCVTWGYERFLSTWRQKEFFSCYWTRWQKNVVLKDKTGKFYDKYHRHRAIRAMEQLRRQSPQCVDSLEHIWQFSKTKSRLLK